LCSGDGARCINEHGGYVCECIQGYFPNYNINGEFRVTCEDIDECSDACLNNCSQSVSHCVNSPGSFSCECKAGFLKSENDTCVDIDECSLINHSMCNANGECINKPGGFECKCNAGFYGNGTHCQGNAFIV
jgi:fibulin 1/2